MLKFSVAIFEKWAQTKKYKGVKVAQNGEKWYNISVNHKNVKLTNLLYFYKMNPNIANYVK